jgi:hypothetical protein
MTLDPFKVVLIDFNRATPITDQRKDTIFGTPGYFPIQFSWRAGDERWDFFAWGIMLFEVMKKKKDWTRKWMEDEAIELVVQ